MQRRRLSLPGCAAANALLPIYRDEDRTKRVPIIFASRWGDVCLSLKLLDQMGAGEPMSPTGFASSVHNGIAGLISIFEHHCGNVLAISGGSETVSAAAAEALALLVEGAEDVLAVFYEDETPEAFRRFLASNSVFAFALRLRLFKPAEKDKVRAFSWTEVRQKERDFSGLSDTQRSLNMLAYLSAGPSPVVRQI